MIKNFDSLADRLKGIKLNGEDVTPENFIEAIKAEDEHEIEVSEATFLTNEQLDDLKVNIKKTGYEEGKTAGSEMFAKDLKKKFGIDDKDGKSADSIYKYANDKILSDAGKDVEPKLKELQSSLESLQSKYETDISAKEGMINQLTGKIKDSQINSTLMQSMPKNISGIKPNQATALFRMEYNLEYDEGDNLLVKKGGEVLKDNLEKPLLYNDVFSDYLKQNNWISTDGRGGENNNGHSASGFKTIQDVLKHMESNKIDPTSNEGKSMIDKFNQSQE